MRSPSNVNMRVILISLLLILAACDKPRESVGPQPGDLLSSETLLSFTPEQIAYVTGEFGMDVGSGTFYGVDIYKLIYITEDNDDQTMKVSGALFIPLSGDPLPQLSLQHGTVMKRSNVASVNPYNSPEGILGLLTAAMGYLTMVPDYPGLGIHKGIHPYVHARSLANSVVYMIRAVREYCAEDSINLNGQLFLTGYSEGGYATLAAHRLMETEYPDEFEITAVAPMAGPYDVYQSARLILEQGSYAWPSYAAYLFTAYNDIYDLDQAENVFQDPYAGQLLTLFNGDLDFEAVNDQFPAEFAGFLEPDFMTAFLEGSEEIFTPLLEENGLLDWAPSATLRFFHGTADVTVPYSIAEMTVAALNEGADQEVELIPIAGGTHESAGLPAMAGMLAWFESFRE